MRQISNKISGENKIPGLTVVLCCSILAVLQTGCASSRAVQPAGVSQGTASYSPYQTNYPAQTQWTQPQASTPVYSPGANNQPANAAWYQQWNWPKLRPAQPFNFAQRSC